MDETSDTRPRTAEPTVEISYANLDPETILLLVEDKISTGG